MNSKHARTHTHTRRAGGAWCGQWRVCVWCGRWGRDTEDLGRSRSTNARGTHAQESHAAPRGGGGATGRRRNANAATQQQRGGCRVFGVGGHGGHQGAREGGCERTSVRSECQSLLGYVSPCGEEPVAAAAISARLPCLRFAPCVVRAFFYAFMYTGGSPSTRNKGQAQLPACATHRRPAVAPAATGAMDTFIDMYQTLRDMRKRQLAHQVLSPHSAPLATCRRRLPLACAGIKRRCSAAARDLCALSTLSSCDPPQVLNLAMIVCSALMIWKVTRSYTCIHT